MAEEKCGARWRLNCGCCADIAAAICERKPGHTGPHREKFKGSEESPLPAYLIQWKYED